MPAPISATYADFKMIKTRQVCQIVFEIPLEAGTNFVKDYGLPNPAGEEWFALAKLVQAKAPAPSQIGTRAAPRRWDEMNPAQQAGIRCAEPAFQRFIHEERDIPCSSDEEAAEFVRSLCGISSRAQLTTDKAAAAAWRELDGAFDMWMRAVA